jgi:hypothetical protein
MRYVWRFAAVVAVAAAAAGGMAQTAVSQTPSETGCPAGFERLAVASLEAQGPYFVPRLVDTGGNNNGFVCGLALPDAVRDAFCRQGVQIPCELQRLGLPVYTFLDDNLASG